ncbi:MAG: T9SS type A sorting domain-containing protein [Bacteroidota bacterium]
MRTCYFLCCCVLSTFLTAQETLVVNLPYDGEDRSYRLYVPAAFDGETPLPLVFNLHGFTSNASQQEFYADMNAVADTAGFFVCYANGIDAAWNVNWDFGSTADDVGFISFLIDEISSEYPVLLDQVYSCGMSNGGFMSYRLACELNDRIAAVASVTGSMSPGYIGNCTPNRPVPVLEIHGTADPVVSYDGTANVSISVDSLLTFWANNNGCDGSTITTDLENTSLLDLCTAEKIDYQNCAASVEHYKINGGGHTWPGAPISIGVTNQDFHGSAAVWQFFQQHRLPELTNTITLTGEHAWRVYPNPGQSWLAVQHLDGPYVLELYQATGQLLQRHNSNDNQRIDLGNLPTGLYFLRIKQGALTVIRPWVKQ